MPYVRQRIEDLRDGKGREDWEGEWPTRALAESAWQVAVTTFRETTPPPSVVPTAEGWIAFIWHKNGYDAEIEVGPDGASAWIYDRTAKQSWSGLVKDHCGCCVERLLDAVGGVPGGPGA